jgi:hypothetical protein
MAKKQSVGKKRVVGKNEYHARNVSKAYSEVEIYLG